MFYSNWEIPANLRKTKPPALQEPERSPCPAWRREGRGSHAFPGDTSDADPGGKMPICQKKPRSGVKAKALQTAAAPLSCALRGGSGRAGDPGRYQQRKTRRVALQRRCRVGDGSALASPAESPTLLPRKSHRPGKIIVKTLRRGVARLIRRPFFGYLVTAWQKNTNEDAELLPIHINSLARQR